MKIVNMFGTGKGIDMDCIACRLYEECITPQMEVSGKGRLGILIIIEAPTLADDKDGIYLSGTWGNFFDSELAQLGLNLDNDFWITGAVQCTGGKNPPTEKQIAFCNKNLVDTIEKLNPKFIWTIGNVASKSLLGKGLKTVSISALNGMTIPLHDLGAWCMPIISPATVLNKNHDKNLRNYYKRTLKNAMGFIKDAPSLPKVNPFNDITFLHGAREINDLIDKIVEKDLITAFDFEATGLDPWREGHHITTMAIATETQSYAFPIEHPEANYSNKEIDSVMDAVCDYLECRDIIKIGHNVNFDKLWGHWILGAEPKGVFHCSMNTSHILDNRQGNNGLKDQTFIRWGIINYDADAAGYIKSVPGTYFNRMMKMPLGKQLLYVGADARLTLKLHQHQRMELTKGQKKAEIFFVNSLETLFDLQNNGLIVNSDYYKKVNAELLNAIEEITDRINLSQDAKDYTKRYKSNFKYSSPIVLKRLLFEMRKIKPIKFTDKGNASVDEEALGAIDYWMCEDIVKLRKLEKLRGTYVKQYLKGIDGVVHPTFQLHTTTSFRSSCKNPNIQNTPKRNAYSKNLIRTGMIPPKGWKMFEVDVSGCEVSTSAMYHKDPTFMKYLTTPGTDMHRDNTCDIWMCDPEEVTKMMRFFIKNMWTFAQFYGDYFGSCAPNLWNTCLDEEKLKMENGCWLEDHINAMGITELGTIHRGHCTPGSFLEHCQKVEHKMWNERFPVYTQWKKDINDFYNEHGYVETFLGFIYTGYMDNKQTTNFPVQGTAFHLLMWCLNKVNRTLKKEKWESYLVGEVHDSMIGYVHPDEEADLFPMIKEICSVDLPNHFDFINVPFNIEIELSETDGNFAEITEIKL